MSLLAKAVLGVLPHVPKPVMRVFARNYIAGETLPDALAKLRELAHDGHPGILDILGEDVTTEAASRAVAAEYMAAAAELARAKLDCYVSIKPTHVGLRLSPALALKQYAEIAKHLKPLGLFLRVEMEDASTTDATIALFEALRAEHDNVGIVLQSRLFRTPDDIAALKPGPLSVRMVKGIYLEPAKIAHTEVEPIREAYIACTKQLMARRAKLSLATHDDIMAVKLLPLVTAAGYAKSEYELQVLLGVRSELWARWKSEGHTVRVYVPYGPEWKPYSLRRMRKNPQIFWHVVRASLGMRAK
ncbi:MAG TPA: proline dehydrogenase family protein [Planctomycetota bacterium]|nr:proline dehydrogenase family protein [Planctomycetota bacterium]